MGSPLPFSKYRAPNIMRYLCDFLVNSHHFSPFPTTVVQWLVYLLYSHISGMSKSSCKIFRYFSMKNNESAKNEGMPKTVGSTPKLVCKTALHLDEGTERYHNPFYSYLYIFGA